MNSLLTAGGLGILALLALVADSGIRDSGFTAFWTGVALLALAATARSVLLSDFGSAVAWGYIAVFVSIAPLLLTLSLTHVSAIWDPAACDPATPCTPAGPIMWIPMLLYAASLAFVWRAVRTCKGKRAGLTAEIGR